MPTVTPDMLLAAYRAGIFPMAEDRAAAALHWFDPPRRGVLPIAGLHVPRRLARTVRQKPYRISFDKDFRGVMKGCADARPDTWINAEILELYAALHDRGHAHCTTGAMPTASRPGTAIRWRAASTAFP
jgi:leucyl/phenylalanyl-tRNA---protein transferase